MSHSDHQPKSKQHAQRRDVHRRYPLWVYNPDDWRTMKDLPVGDLICPKPGCRAELVPVERKTGTRFLRNRPGTSDCGHAFARGQGGGPPSPEHRWFQQRLAMLCADLGYDAVQEHYASRADVWVESAPPLAIEVQRVNTNFSDRSVARRTHGANVLWLLPESASSPKAGKELFRQPAARIRVMKREDRSVEAKPWEPGHTGQVLLWIGATVMRPSEDGLALVSAGNYDAKEFLRDVLSGARRWYGPNEPEFRFGSGWAIPTDVESVREQRAAVQRAREAAVRRAREAVEREAIERAREVAERELEAAQAAVRARNEVLPPEIPRVVPMGEDSGPPAQNESGAVPVPAAGAPSAHGAAVRPVATGELTQPSVPGATPVPIPRRSWLHRLRAWWTNGNAR